MKRYKKASDITVGVVGYGGAFKMGRVHLEEMHKAGMTPVAVADPDTTCLADAEKDFPGIETYTSLRQMLRKTDVKLVTLITPHNTHAPLALEALRAGRHVVCEKPLAITTAECDRMIAAAKKAGVLLSTYHNRHWDGGILRALKEIRQRGRIGDVVRVECHMGHHARPGDWWRSSKTISGGILYDWGVHLLEYSLQLIDSDLVEVSGYAKRGFWAPKTAWGDDTIEDEGFAVARFASGQWVTLRISNIETLPRPGKLEIVGTRGCYIFDEKWWKTVLPRKGGSVTTVGENPNKQWWRFYGDIAAHLVKGTKLVITPEWARRPIHILDLAGKSAEKGRAQKAKYA
ncbi:MAG: Gfo/Idh/MocA family oxidoreductase [Phycisphaerae bacterium]|nr:Gfo/Idh/MocA family oxidoreductase [Phycisphaerae bacterium]